MKIFLLPQEQTNGDFTSPASKLGPTSDTIAILCIDFTITSWLVAESNFNCTCWGCRYHLDHRGVSCPWINTKMQVIFQPVLRICLSVKFYSSKQPVPHDNQNNSLIFLSSVTPQWPPQRAESQGGNIYGKQICLFAQWSQHSGSSEALCSWLIPSPSSELEEDLDWHLKE